MVFSDAIYGKSPRYVSRERLNLMLDHEYVLLVERLSAIRGDRTNFFVFADTVATSNTRGPTRRMAGWASGSRLRRWASRAKLFCMSACGTGTPSCSSRRSASLGSILIYGALYLSLKTPDN